MDLIGQSLDLLNVGCGNNFHPRWTNIDLIAGDDSVQACDLREGIPFADKSFDAVYHSHVLEHFSPEDGEKLIVECFRVLRPGGILRVVVPDLERIAQLYLEMHQHALDGKRQAEANYQWMKLELLDQLVRDRSGGLMGQYISDPQISNVEFVRQRIGREFGHCRSRSPKFNGNGEYIQEPTEANGSSTANDETARDRKISVWFTRVREKAAMKVVRYLLGRDKCDAFSEGLFRQNGEVHRWMYDRFSLSDVCVKAGFDSFKVCSASESDIESFDKFELDVVNREIRKPDSLFAECRRPENS